MLSFIEYIIESSGSSHNKDYGEAYETATVLHIHKNTGARHNADPEYRSQIKEIMRSHKDAMSRLPPHLQDRARVAARDSGTAYINSLQSNHKMKPEDIHSVHHTHLGIDAHVGRKVDRAQNPHDLVVKGKKGFIHGASLKATSGTASNNPVKAFDRNGGLKTNTSSIWDKAKKKYGLEGMSKADIKKIRDNPKIVKANQETQRQAAIHHAKAFGKSDLATQKKHIGFLLKSNPDLPYDYVKGEKGGSATPHHMLPHLQALNKAKSLRTTVDNNRVHIHDHMGNHIATIEHRTTHGSFSSPQANAKFGNMKKGH